MNFEKILENGRLWAVVYEENGVISGCESFSSNTLKT